MSKRKAREIYEKLDGLKRMKAEADRGIEENTKELETLPNLIREEKIILEETTLDDFLNTEEGEDVLFLHYSNGNRRCLVALGLKGLDEDDRTHWSEFAPDYLYYGYPDYASEDVVGEEPTKSDREIGEDNGSVRVRIIRREDIN
jgi:hypothetical protein